MIAGHNGFFNKIIVHSPAMNERAGFHNNYHRHQVIFNSNFDILIKERIEKISDVLIPSSTKIDGWVDRVSAVVGNNWSAPYQVFWDHFTYWVLHRNHGMNFDNRVDVLSIAGEYDNEMLGTAVSLSEHDRCGYPHPNDKFNLLFPHNRTVIIPNSTHFSMWENNSHLTRQAIIDYIKE
jgi:pimeloyl-ACP methyl ester carboxylesterase